jgi:hypothetical protein
VKQALAELKAESKAATGSTGCLPTPARSSKERAGKEVRDQRGEHFLDGFGSSQEADNDRCPQLNSAT